MKRTYYGAAWLFAAHAMVGTPSSAGAEHLGREGAVNPRPHGVTSGAHPAAPTWQETVSEDLHGPKVQLSAEILAQLRDGDYTCFVLDPYFSPAHAPVVACNAGYFTQKEFAPGRTLNVSGNMGAATPRRIGAEVYDYPVIAGAIIKPGPERGSYPYSYQDPYYDPFWPHTPFHRGYWW